MAGYKPSRNAPYRLYDNVRTKRRISELNRSIAMKTRVTVESLTDEFNDAIALAKETKNAPAITQAALAKGKLHGLIVDRKESGAPGDFAALTTVDEVLTVIRSELGEGAAAALTAALARDEPEEEEQASAIEPTHDAPNTRN